MAAAKKAAAKKVSAKKARQAEEPQETFEIRYDVPIVSNRALANQPLIEKIERTIPEWREGGAIAIDATKKNTVLNHLKRKYPHNLWSAAKILGNDSQIRIYLTKKNYVAPVKKARKKAVLEDNGQQFAE